MLVSTGRLFFALTLRFRGITCTHSCPLVKPYGASSIRLSFAPPAFPLLCGVPRYYPPPSSHFPLNQIPASFGFQSPEVENKIITPLSDIDPIK